jgi:hypothetical protein
MKKLKASRFFLDGDDSERYCSGGVVANHLEAGGRKLFADQFRIFW